MTSLKSLACLIKERGPIKVARVSCAGTRTNRNNKFYYDIVPYTIKLNKNGVPTCVAERSAQKRYTLKQAAIALEAEVKAGSIPFQGIGRLTEKQAEEVLEHMTQKLLEAYVARRFDVPHAL